MKQFNTAAVALGAIAILFVLLKTCYSLYKCMSMREAADNQVHSFQEGGSDLAEKASVELP